jgi:hypothetical protein
VLVTAIREYLGAKPPRLAPAQVLLQQLDALGSGSFLVRFSQFLGHDLLLGYWRMLYVPDSIRQQATKAIALLDGMTEAEREGLRRGQMSNSELARPFLSLFWLANDVQDLAGEQTIVDQCNRMKTCFDQADPLDEKLLKIMQAIYGKQSQPLQGDFWFNTGGKVHPAPGVVSIIVHIPIACGDNCYSLYRLLRKIHARYGSDVDISIVTDTQGYSMGAGLLTPEEESKMIAHYIIDEWKLPVALLVDKTSFTVGEDGRRKSIMSPIGKMFDEWKAVNSVLIDRTGKVQWVGNIGKNGGYDRMFEAVIDRVTGHAASGG